MPPPPAPVPAMDILVLLLAFPIKLQISDVCPARQTRSRVRHHSDRWRARSPRRRVGDCLGQVVSDDGGRSHISSDQMKVTPDHFHCPQDEIQVITRRFHATRKLLRNCSRLPHVLADTADAIALT